MFIIAKKQEKTYSLPTKEIKVKNLQSMSSNLAERILFSLTSPKYPKQIAKELKEDEQKVYYHIRNLEKNNIIKLVKKETMQGAKANYYQLTSPSYTIKFSDLQQTQKITEISSKQKDFLNPFITDGKLNALIIVGSPDPHGPEKARARDGYYGMDLALFLGTFLNYVPKLNVRLDTETREEDLKNNLIIIGGPVVNKITYKINNKLPIFFDQENHYNIKSNLSKKHYPSDEAGIIIKCKNPFDKNKSILLISGKRHPGTKAAIIAFTKYFDKICQKDSSVVEGIDLDSDGIVDDIEILE